MFKTKGRRGERGRGRGREGEKERRKEKDQGLLLAKTKPSSAPLSMAWHGTSRGIHGPIRTLYPPLVSNRLPCSPCDHTLPRIPTSPSPSQLFFSPIFQLFLYSHNKWNLPKNCSNMHHIFHAGTGDQIAGFGGAHNFLVDIIAMHSWIGFLFSKATLDSYLDFVMPLLHAMNAFIISNYFPRMHSNTSTF